MRRIGSLLVVIWLIIGVVAAAQRSYFSSRNVNCAKLGRSRPRSSRPVELRRCQPEGRLPRTATVAVGDATSVLAGAGGSALNVATGRAPRPAPYGRSRSMRRSSIIVSPRAILRRLHGEKPLRNSSDSSSPSAPARPWSASMWLLAYRSVRCKHPGAPRPARSRRLRPGR